MINQDSFCETINDAINLHRQSFFPRIEGIRILQLLNKIKTTRGKYGQTHPSIPSLLNEMGNILDEFSLPHLSNSFFLEQLRIEKHYLGFKHIDLASTYYRIGETYAKNNQILEAAEYFLEAFLILQDNNTKGRLYALTIYNLGLVTYHQHSYDDAFKLFNFAINELQATVGEFHLGVAELHMEIANLQVEIGSLIDAMDNYLKALMILRMVYGSANSKVAEILYRVGCIHKTQGEYDASLNSLHQALDSLEKVQDGDTHMIIILHEIGLIYQMKGDVTNAIKILEEIIQILTLRLGEKHISHVSVLSLLSNLYVEYGMVENSKHTAKQIKEICSKMSNYPYQSCNCEFENTAIEIFGYPMDYSPPAAGAA